MLVLKSGLKEGESGEEEQEDRMWSVIDGE